MLPYLIKAQQTYISKYGGHRIVVKKEITINYVFIFDMTMSYKSIKAGCTHENYD